VSGPRFTDRGFAQIRRGLREHLSKMSSDAVKLYLWLHLVVYWTGKQRGTVETNRAQIMEELRWSETRTKRVISELRKHYIKIVRRGNQHSLSLIRILKYRKSASFARVTNEPSKSARVTGGPNTDPSTGPSTSRKAAPDAGSSAPNKAVEGNRSKAAAEAAADSVWVFLEIQPCGPLEFQKLLESSWLGRNGAKPSEVIGHCLDAWETTGATGKFWKHNLAPLFRALDRQRKVERAQTRPTAEIEEEIPLAVPYR
jgi:hypothetical protein